MPGQTGEVTGVSALLIWSGMRGVFVTFEGPEGSGKSTQIRLLAEQLEAAGYDVIQVREPGGTPAGEVIRNLLQHDGAGENLCPAAETLLFSASRAQLVEEVIAPALARGATVLCDRFADSTTAYQGYGRGFDPDQLAHLHDFALGPWWPDATILLDLPVEEGLRRIMSRAAGAGSNGLDRMEREALAFHARVAEGYRALAVRYPERFRVVDGRLPVEKIRDEISRHLVSWLPALKTGGRDDG